MMENTDAYNLKHNVPVTHSFSTPLRNYKCSSFAKVLLLQLKRMPLALSRQRLINGVHGSVLCSMVKFEFLE